VRNDEARANPGPDASAPIVAVPDHAGNKVAGKRGTRGTCGRCGRRGDIEDVDVILLDRLAAGVRRDRLPMVDVTLTDPHGGSYTVTVPERFVHGWRCRNRAECLVDAVPALSNALDRRAALS
jgi:hypothetical protein